MINTYLNDNQSMPYPFYGGEALPFSMAAITGMGICIRAKADETFSGYNTIYAENVTITEDSVSVAVCRRPSTGGTELVGMFYARTDGYSIYVPSYVDSSVYENQSILSPMLRLVYDDEDATSDDSPVAASMRAYYSRVRTATSITLSTVSSSGYIQLGTITASDIGSYSGVFYLDPSCVTYLVTDTFGNHDSYRIGETPYTIGQRLDIDLEGLLTWNDNNIVTVFEADKQPLVVLPGTSKKRITSINGYTPSGDRPILDIHGQQDLIINGTTISGPIIDVTADTVGLSADRHTVVIKLEGTSVFPNCDRS